MNNRYVLTLLLTLLSLAIFAQSEDPKSEYYWGIGLRLGDPSGFTVKKYFDDKAIEFNVGSSPTLNNNDKYYGDKYNDWYNDNRSSNAEHYVTDYHVNNISVQLHYLKHKEIKDAEGLKWFYGGGLQLRSQTVRYDYMYRYSGSSIWLSASDKTTYIDLGIDGVVGLEYLIPESPITLFAEADLFIELLDDPFKFWFQGGVGGRFNF